MLPALDTLSSIPGSSWARLVVVAVRTRLRLRAAIFVGEKTDGDFVLTPICVDRMIDRHCVIRWTIDDSLFKCVMPQHGHLELLGTTTIRLVISLPIPFVERNQIGSTYA